MQTLLKNPGQPMMGTIYGLWHDMLVLENGSPTSTFHDEGRIRALALQWEDTARNFTIKEEGYSTFSSIEQETSPCIPNLEKAVVDFSVDNGVPIADIVQYYGIINKTFTQIAEVSVTLSSDYEIENYTKIRFSLKSKCSVDEMLECETEFKKTVRSLISRESRANFILTYQIV